MLLPLDLVLANASRCRRSAQLCARGQPPPFSHSLPQADYYFIQTKISLDASTGFLFLGVVDELTDLHPSFDQLALNRTFVCLAFHEVLRSVILLCPFLISSAYHPRDSSSADGDSMEPAWWRQGPGANSEYTGHAMVRIQPCDLPAGCNGFRRHVACCVQAETIH